MKMRNLMTTLFVITAVYFLSAQVDHSSAMSSNANTDNHRNRARGNSKYHSRSSGLQYGRIKPDTIFNDFGDEDDIFDLSKRQQPPSDDYGHLRFGRRDDKFDDYGHMRFGRGDMK